MATSKKPVKKAKAALKATASKTATKSKPKPKVVSKPDAIAPDALEVQIGEQVWMTKNLDVLKFSNGDDIPLIKNDKDWKACYDSKKPACCYINNDPKTAANGILYNWFAVNDKRGLAPKGYTIPSLDAWKKLIGKEDPKKVGKILKSKDGWKNGAKNSNATGLSITPNETRMFGEFSKDSDSASLWTSTQAMESYAMSIDIAGKGDKVDFGSVFMDTGLAVRCLKK